MYADQGRYDEAEALYLEALEGRARILGEDHQATLRTRNHLADMYERQGRHAEAERLRVEDE
ncbi:MAG: tetratricopeptide repeat protein [Gammaproteobacteria bacterium]|nr:tetratricopeptide repeat protein [Gammaproteobacteria bacterium]